MEYDENIAAFIYALGIGCITTIALIMLRMIDGQVYSKRKALRLYANLLGTPITPIIAYIMAWIIAIAFKLPSAK